MSLSYLSIQYRIFGPNWLSIGEIVALAKLLDIEPGKLLMSIVNDRKAELNGAGYKSLEEQKKV